MNKGDHGTTKQNTKTLQYLSVETESLMKYPRRNSNKYYKIIQKVQRIKYKRQRNMYMTCMSKSPEKEILQKKLKY